MKPTSGTQCPTLLRQVARAVPSRGPLDLEGPAVSGDDKLSARLSFLLRPILSKAKTRPRSCLQMRQMKLGNLCFKTFYKQTF